MLCFQQKNAWRRSSFCEHEQTDGESQIIERVSETPCAPQTLAAAEQRFRAFLATNGYPETIRWLGNGDMLVDKQRRFWIRERRTKASRQAALRYSEGLERNLGIALCAVCSSERETFASVFLPEDDVDRQYHLMGHGLKLSCPVEMPRASRVNSPLRWLLLRLRNGQRSRMLEL